MSGNLTADQMVLELQRRITQLAPTPALAAINAAIRWIGRQGSFTFHAWGSSVISVAAHTGVAIAPNDMDVGKVHIITDVLTGMTVPKVGIQDSTMDDILSIPIDLPMFSYYTIREERFFFKPTFNAARDIRVEYTGKTTDIAGSLTSRLPREFDDLIIDLAEARERRVYDVGDQWVQLLAMVQDQVKLLLDGYRSTSLEVESGGDTQAAVQEKTAIGRG